MEVVHKVLKEHKVHQVVFKGLKVFREQQEQEHKEQQEVKEQQELRVL